MATKEKNHLSLQGITKFTQIGIFGLKNETSGNPGARVLRLMRGPNEEK
jgi:hypothetical protein